MIGINVMPYEPAALKEIMARVNVTWRTFADADGSIFKKWNTPGTPAYYLIDADGFIRHKWFGNPGEKALEVALAKLIREAKSSD